MKVCLKSSFRIAGIKISIKMNCSNFRLVEYNIGTPNSRFEQQALTYTHNVLSVVNKRTEYLLRIHSITDAQGSARVF